MNTVKNRYQYIDILNILACLSVIFMHCNGIVHTFENCREWKESMIVETVCYWAVPVFFMITGTTLMGYRERYGTGTFFKKRFLKTFVPFVVWTLISLAYKTAFHMTEFDWKAGSALNLFNGTTIEPVYWFFIPLYMVYLSMPVLSLLKDNIRILIYMSALSFLIFSVYPVFCGLIHIPPNGSVVFPVAAGYVLYVLLGYLASVTDFSRRQRMVIYILALSGILVRYGSTVVWSVQSETLNKTFWGYLNFPAVFLAFGVFVFVKYIPWEKYLYGERIRRWISALAGASFGIYLMHMMVYHLLERLIRTGAHSYIWRFCVPFLVYFICAFAVLIIKKIPVLKNIVP